VQARYPDDPIAAYYLSRIAEFSTALPAADWDGTETLSEK
jgi:hypothetical protein